MHKKHISAIVIVLSIFLIAVNIKPILNCTSDLFWNSIFSQLDKENEERHRRMENGEIVRGRDTVLIWGDMYEIVHYIDGNHLSIQKGEISGNILEKVEKHKVVKGSLYIVSDEGYAVINDNNICRVFVTVSDDEFVDGYTKDDDGNTIGKSRKINCKYIEYLSSFNDFTHDEQQRLNNLK